MSVVPINDKLGGDTETKVMSVPEESAQSFVGDAALARMNLSSNSQDVNEKGGYKVYPGQGSSASQAKDFAQTFKSSKSRRISRIKYSGYGEEYAIQQIKKGDAANTSKKYKNLRRKRGDPGCFIDPHNPFMKKWDPYMTFLLLYTALVTPYEVGFLASPETWPERWADGLWVFNQIVNISFLVDLVFNFFLAYTDPETGISVNSQKAIIRHYLSFWFWIDFASIVPFDLLTSTGQPEVEVEATSDGDLSSLKAIRLVRLLRLLKLVRIFKASRIFGRIQSRLGLSYAELSLYKFGILLLILAHWLAVAWYMSATLLSDEWLNWSTNYGLYGDESDHFNHYTTSIYWALMTLTTIGYGDVVPVTIGERWVAIFAMAVGGAFYAYMVGAVCGIVSSMDIAGIEYRQTMDNLNAYLREVQAPPELRVKLREYFGASREAAKQKYYTAVIEQLSPGLKAELAGYVNKSWIEKIYFLSEGPSLASRSRFTAELALQLTGHTFPSTEYVVRMGDPTDSMYIIKKGLVARMNAVLSTGRHFGEDVVLHGATRLYTVRALTFLSVYTVSKESLESVLNIPEFSFQRKVVRRATIKLSLRNTFINFHNIVLKMKQWVEHDADPMNEGKTESLAPRQQYYRYLETNPIFITLCQKHGSTKKALERLGYTKIFRNIQDEDKSSSPMASVDPERTALEALDAMQMELERLQSSLRAKT
jgi:potassium voltage-gated channel Eag-related subfamily H protein 7